MAELFLERTDISKHSLGRLGSFAVPHRRTVDRHGYRGMHRGSLDRTVRCSHDNKPPRRLPQRRSEIDSSPCHYQKSNVLVEVENGKLHKFILFNLSDL